MSLVMLMLLTQLHWQIFIFKMVTNLCFFRELAWKLYLMLVKRIRLSKLGLWTWTPGSHVHAGLLPQFFLPCGKEICSWEVERSCGSSHWASCPMENSWVLLGKMYRLDNWQLRSCNKHRRWIPSKVTWQVFLRESVVWFIVLEVIFLISPKSYKLLIHRKSAGGSFARRENC